jgi:SAM-dependent methyltransferase
MPDAVLGTQGKDYFVRDTCRLCASRAIDEVLRLEPTPPANEFLTASEREAPQDTFPLGLWQCQQCYHVQLPVVVNPERLFRNYVYVSGTSPVFVDHFRRYAEAVVRTLKLEPKQLVVDVGSNDGTLLRFYRDLGMKVLGVDPARDIAQRATDEGLETLPEFLSEALARRIREERGPAQVVTANNVFAHADDLAGVARAVRTIIGPSGVFVFEVYYLVDFCQKLLFDTVYHEHLAYHSIGSLVPFFQALGMRVFDVERVDTHGGSIRVYVDQGMRAVSPRVDELRRLELESGFPVAGWPAPSRPSPLLALEARISDLSVRLGSRLRQLRADGKRIAGYGAPAKATTLMHQFGLGRDVLDFVVDDNPLKQGRFTPGVQVPVVPSSALSEQRPDYLLVLAWNFAEPIMKKCEPFHRDGGKFIIPLPELREY